MRVAALSLKQQHQQKAVHAIAQAGFEQQLLNRIDNLKVSAVHSGLQVVRRLLEGAPLRMHQFLGPAAAFPPSARHHLASNFPQGGGKRNRAPRGVVGELGALVELGVEAHDGGDDSELVGGAGERSAAAVIVFTLV